MSWQSIKQKIANNDLVTNTATLISATVFGQLALIMVSPILTRLYTPEEFGVLAIFTSILGIVVVISRLRYELAIPLPKSNNQARQLLKLSLIINIFFVLLTILLVSKFGESLSDFTKTPILERYLWLLPLAIFFLGSYKAFNFWAIRGNQFKLIAKTKVSQIITNIVIQISGGILGLGALGLILGQIAGQTMGVCKLAKGLKIKELFRFNKIILLRYLALAKQYSKFPKYDVPASFVNTLSNELPQLFFAILFSPYLAGLYLLANRVLAVPLGVIGQSLAQVLYGDVSKELKNGSLRNTTLKVILVLVSLVIIPALIVLFFGPDLFSIIFGKDWKDAGELAAILILGISAQFVYSPISLNLLATGDQHINFLIHFIMLLLRSIGIYIGWTMGEPLVAVWTFSAVGLIMYSVATLLVLNRIKAHQIRLSNENA